MSNWSRLAMLGAGLLAAAMAGCETSPKTSSPQGAGAGGAQGNSSVVVLDRSNFKSVTASGVVLVDFWAEWCRPCRMQGPIVDKLAEEYAGRAIFAKLDTETNQAIARQYEVEAIPTLLVFKDGKLVRRLVGLQGAGELRDVMESMLSGG